MVTLDIKFMCGYVLWLTIISPSVNCVDNLALRKPVWMSSTLTPEEKSRAEYAVAGTTGGNYESDECSHTATGDLSPWITVDLLGQYYIHNVTIYNRMDCCSTRLHDIIVDIFTMNPSRCDSAQPSVCKNYPGVFGRVETLVCDAPVVGRFVRIWKYNIDVSVFGDETITICELEVYGTRQDCGSFRYIPVPNRRLVSPAMTTLNVSSISSCVAQCFLSRACVGVNYNKVSRACELLARPEPTESFSDDSFWTYIGNDLC